MKTKAYENVHFRDNTFRKVRIINDIDVLTYHSEPMITWHEQLELLHFREGGAVVFIGASRVIAQKGDIFVINALEPHLVRCINENTRYDVVMIERAVYHELLRELCLKKYGSPMSDRNACFRNAFTANDNNNNNNNGNGNGSGIGNGIDNGYGKLAFLLDAIVMEFKNDEFANDIVIERYAQNLIVELFRAEPVEFKPIKDGEWAVLNYQRLEPVFKYLDDNYTKQVCLDDLAAICLISKYYFSRLFKKATGQTVVEYVNSLRLSLANRLLHSTGLPVAEVARQAGFDDNCYFGRIYKKEFGVSPNKIR